MAITWAAAAADCWEPWEGVFGVPSILAHARSQTLCSRPSVAFFIEPALWHPVRTISCSFLRVELDGGKGHLPGRSRRRQAFSLVAARFYV